MAEKPKTEIPDLVLEPQAPRAREVSTQKASASGTWGGASASNDELSLESLSQDPFAGHAELGAADNELDLFAGDAGAMDLSFELERAYSPSAAPGPMEAPQERVRARSSHPPPRTWPTGRTPIAEELVIDPLEVAIAASFDKAPTSVVLSPVYTAQVFVQRRKLLPVERSARERLVQAEKSRDALLVELAETCRPIIETNDRFRTMLTALGESESLTSERAQALGRAHADVAGAQSELDAKLATIAAEESVATQSAGNARLLLDKAEEAHKRVEVQVKRIDIERRSVMDVARHKLGPQGGALPPELAAKIAELDARQAALSPDLESSRRERDAARLGVDDAEGRLKALAREARLIQGAKQDYEKRQRGELDLREQGMSEAEDQRRKALVGVGQRVLELRGEVPVDGPRLDALTAADESVLRELVSAEKLRRALDSYDFDAEKKGRLILIALCALSVLSILIALFK
jgi:hypothetical protein